jgi:hypothetical protein
VIAHDRSVITSSLAKKAELLVRSVPIVSSLP